MRRYVRLGPRRGARPRLRRYVRDPLPSLDISIEYLDDIVFPNLERAFKRGRIRKVIGRFGDISLIQVGYKDGRIASVFHLAFEASRHGARLRHLGLKRIDDLFLNSEPDLINIDRLFRRRKR